MILWGHQQVLARNIRKSGEKLRSRPRSHRAHLSVKRTVHRLRTVPLHGLMKRLLQSFEMTCCAQLSDLIAVEQRLLSIWLSRFKSILFCHSIFMRHLCDASFCLGPQTRALLERKIQCKYPGFSANFTFYFKFTSRINALRYCLKFL